MSGNTFGTLFAVTNFGESHGPAIGCVIDGCPPGMALSEADIQGDLTVIPYAGGVRRQTLDGSNIGEAIKSVKLFLSS